MEKGEKVVVVSQWKSFLAIIQEHLKLAKIRCTLFTGDLNTAKRQEIITEFNEEKGKIKVTEILHLEILIWCNSVKLKKNTKILPTKPPVFRCLSKSVRTILLTS
jgi:Helicase conserved C-terminal domain